MSEDSELPNNSDPNRRIPFRKFSMLGKADKYEAKAANAKPLLGRIAFQGQATMIYTAPGAGKTLLTIALITQGVLNGAFDPSAVYYINADDNNAGLATKLRLFQDLGVNMLAPGCEGFRVSHLIDLLRECIENGSASGLLIILDTMKKFANLMNKNEMRDFNQLLREATTAGATIVALGHTAKNPHPNGTLRYQGTTDVLEDFDAVYLGQALVSPRIRNERVIKLEKLKSRADSPETAAYVYSTAEGISYDAKVASVREVDPDDIQGHRPEVEAHSDPVVMKAIVELIEAGESEGQMALAKAAAKMAGVSHRTALQVLERYTGAIPHTHLWDFDKGPRGVRRYRLIDQNPPEADAG